MECFQACFWIRGGVNVQISVGQGVLDNVESCEVVVNYKERDAHVLTWVPVPSRLAPQFFSA